VSRQIVCRRCGQSADALDHAPLPGRWGPIILDQTCASCWHDWVEEQTRLINHERLLPAQPDHRAILYERMASYLQLER
jgi:Fe-S cluster biosynthesis and repair protein YggX